MASISEQILAAVKTALYNTIPAVGTRVYRARQDAIGRAECPAIVIEYGTEQCELAQLAGDAVRCEMEIEISVHVASAGEWETDADAVAVPAHAAVMGAALPAGATIDGLAIVRTAASGDATPAIRTHLYRASYFRAANALDLTS